VDIILYLFPPYPLLLMNGLVMMAGTWEVTKYNHYAPNNADCDDMPFKLHVACQLYSFNLNSLANAGSYRVHDVYTPLAYLPIPTPPLTFYHGRACRFETFARGLDCLQHYHRTA